mgnify:CR=1 FL=1
MNPKNIIINSIVISILVLVALSGCKDEIVAPITGSVNGAFTLIDAEGNSVGVAGVKVYLIDTDFKPDTVDLSQNMKAIVDSTFSDENGMYKFVNLKEGNYGVAPVPGNSNYYFTPNNSGDSYSFTVNDKKSSFTVNFNVSDLSSTQDKEPLKIRIVSKNLPYLEDSSWDFYFEMGRIEYVLFVPLSDPVDLRSAKGYPDRFERPLFYFFDYGYTTLVYTRSNRFSFSFSEVRGSKSVVESRNKYIFEYDLTLSSCPSSATFEYDWTAHTFTRIE